jgi:hypothetical protein
VRRGVRSFEVSCYMTNFLAFVVCMVCVCSRHLANLVEFIHSLEDASYFGLSSSVDPFYGI